MQIYTVGHSQRAAGELLEILRHVAVEGLADVRRFPRSRRHPHFDRERLAAFLEASGVAYRHLEALGAYRDERPDSRHVALESPALRGYADHMETPGFGAALTRLEAWAGETPVAVLCAEASPRACHRWLLSDALERDGFRVFHVLDAERIERHRPSEAARTEAGRLIYDVGALFPGSGPEGAA